MSLFTMFVPNPVGGNLVRAESPATVTSDGMDNASQIRGVGDEGIRMNQEKDLENMKHNVRITIGEGMYEEYAIYDDPENAMDMNAYDDFKNTSRDKLVSGVVYRITEEHAHPVMPDTIEITKANAVLDAMYESMGGDYDDDVTGQMEALRRNFY